MCIRFRTSFRAHGWNKKTEKVYQKRVYIFFIHSSAFIIRLLAALCLCSSTLYSNIYHLHNNHHIIMFMRCSNAIMKIRWKFVVCRAVRKEECHFWRRTGNSFRIRVRFFCFYCNPTQTMDNFRCNHL